MPDIVGIDVGGTFTDLYYGRDGDAELVLKVPSTSVDPSLGLMEAIRLAQVDPGALNLIVHGTTIATNAVIERKGARCALLTTRGFRDVLELGRRDRPSMYGLTGVHEPLIARDLRFEVDERIGAKGEVVAALDEAGVRALGLSLRERDVEAVVISLLHAYANPDHERAVAALLREIEPEWTIVTSHSVCNEYFEFERTSTAVVQGFLQPLVSRYATQLAKRLGEARYTGDTLIMQSNGGVVELAGVAARASHIVRSGPAAGVMAASSLAAEAGFSHVITGDMGGTSFDVAVVVNGEPKVSRSTKLDFRIPLKLPMIDVHTIGAGGGSIASIDQGGILQVGPHSAGAEPGPACYGRGGTQPTVTDANVVLGRVNWESPIGRTALKTLDASAAKRALAQLGEGLGLTPEEAAEAVLAVVNQGMSGRMRLLSVEQGLDPRDFAFVCFGGAGPLHGAAIMREVGVPTMLVPVNPGVLCAIGCCIADLRHDSSQTLERAVKDLSETEVSAILAAQAAKGRAELERSNASAATPRVRHIARMCYQGQIHTLPVPIDSAWPMPRIGKAFEEVYEAEFGETLGDIPAIIVTLETAVEAPPPFRARRSAEASIARPAVPASTRSVYFHGWMDTAVYQRAALLPGMHFEGPAIVEQTDATTVIEPSMTAHVDGFGNLLVRALS